MLKISNLIKKIDHFYRSAVNDYKLSKLAADPPQTWSMPDDEDGPPTDRNQGQNQLYDELLDLVRTIPNSDAVAEALLIADMYRKALEINGGFNMVKKAIGNFINTQLEDLDPDDEEDPLNELENLLNKIHNDLNQRAKELGGGVNKGDDAAAEKEIRLVKNQFNEQSLQDELAGRNKSVSDLSDFDPSAIAKFDMSGGVSMEDAQTKGRGYFVRSVKEPKDWIVSYENEKQRYLEELSGEQDSKIADRKKKLISLLDQLKVLTAKEATLFAKVQVAPDPTIQNELESVRDKIKAIKKEKTSIKAALRQDSLTRQTDQLVRDLEAASKKNDKKEQFRLEQELLLRKVLRSQDKNKGEETRLRKQLLAFLPHMSNTPTGIDTLKNLLKKIEEAAGKKIPIEEVRKEQAKEIADKKRTIRLDPEKRVNIYDWGSMTLDGFATHLSQALLAERKTIKDKIIGTRNKRVTEEEKSLFKPYLDAIAAAATSGNKTALLKAVHDLKIQINKAARLSPQFVQYVISVRSSKFFYAFRDRLKTLQKMGVEEKNKLSSTEISFIQETIDMGSKLINFYKDLKIPSLKGGPSTTTHYEAPTQKIGIIIRYLQSLLENKSNEHIDSETGEVTYG